jgi:hypothetical protein
MIFQRRRVYSSSPGDYFRLRNESTGKQLFGFSMGSNFLKLGDKEGGQWSGSAQADASGGHLLRFRDGAGKTMTGISDGQTVLMRDSSGQIWKGFVD